MLKRLVAGFVGIALLAGTMLTVAAAQDKKDSPKDKKTTAKDGTEIKGKITKVDLDKKTFTIETADGKKLDFTVTDDVKFVGPRGGPSKEGIKDDRFKVGNEVKLVTDAGGKTLKEVHLPVRKKGGDKGDEKPKDKKAKTDDKPKDKSQ
jgi:hypothetical protein